MKKDEIMAGLSGLLRAPEQLQPQQPQQTAQTKGETKAVCYNLPVELIDKVRYVSFVSRQKYNAIVADALTRYLDEWESEHGEINY